MASNVEFQPVDSQAWLQGFSNLVRKENHLWWNTRRWWVQTLVWWAFISGLLALFIWIIPSASAEAPGEPPMAPEVKCLMFFIIIGSLAPVIGVTLLAQDAILNERSSGTMAWVMTKPVSRPALILSKLLSYAVAILMTMVVFQGVSVYLLTFLATGKAFQIPLYVAMCGVLFLNLLFYLSLTIMVSTLSNGRGLAIGVPLLVMFAARIIPVAAIAPWMADMMPWNLATAFGAHRPAIALSVALGQPLPTWMPVVGTVLWCLIFTGIALWRFQKEEF